MSNHKPFRSRLVSVIISLSVGAGLCTLLVIIWRTLAKYNSILLVIFGILVSVLISFIVYQFQRASLGTARANEAKKLLEIEIHERKKMEDTLQKTLVRMDLAVKAGHMGIWTWDIETDSLSWNERMFELFGLPSEIKPTYQKWLALLHSDDAAHIESLLKKTVQGLAVFDTEFRIITSDKSIRYIRSAARVIKDSDGKPQSMTGLNWDITDSRIEQTALKKSEEQVLLLLNSTGEAIYGIDLEGNCTFANPACLRMTGYASQKTILGRNMHDLIHHSYADGTAMNVKVCKIYKAFKDGQPVHVDDEVLWRSDGTSFPAEYWSYPQTIAGVICGAVVTFIDITERKCAAERIQYMATHDALTDLPSLRLARDRLTMALSQARRYKKTAAVMFIDLDGFKAVNDSFGHDAGDEVLRQVAKRLTSVVRETDTVARIGGDEFLLVITELQNPGSAAKIADKVLALLAKPIDWKNAQPKIGASIGIALFPQDGTDIDTLIKKADDAMYNVKTAGKNSYRFVGKNE